MLFAIAMLLQVAVPPSTEVELSEGDVRQMLMVAQSREGASVEKAMTLKGPALETALRGAIADRTRVIYDEEEGVIVQYAATDGQLRRWYPGSRIALPGRWGVQRMNKKLTNACFRFPAAADPAASPFTPSECVRTEQALSSAGVLRQWRGDVFGLMRGIPYAKSAMGMPTP